MALFSLSLSRSLFTPEQQGEYISSGKNKLISYIQYKEQSFFGKGIDNSCITDPTIF
jgi:hypothetical protein